MEKSIHPYSEFEIHLHSTPATLKGYWVGHYAILSGQKAVMRCSLGSTQISALAACSRALDCAMALIDEMPAGQRFTATVAPYQSPVEPAESAQYRDTTCSAL